MSNEINKLKIGFVLDDSLDKTDGVQQYVLSIGSWLSLQGYEVHYLVGATKRQDIEHVHSLSRNIAVKFNGNRMSMPLPSSPKKLRALLDRENFDVLHIQVPYSPYLAHRLIKAASARTAIVGTFHIVGDSLMVKTGTKLLGKWTKSTLKRFDCMISVSKAAQAYAYQTFKVDSVVLPNVIDYKRFHSATPLPYKEKLLTILFLGRLVPRKGCLILLMAITELIKTQTVPFQVLICGNGPLRVRLEQYVSQHNLTRIVHFVGYIDEAVKPRYYASSDIAVFPSTGGESFGIVLLEAMASNRAAVLAAKNAGYSSVLEPYPDLLFTPNNVSELVKKLKRYLEDSTLRDKVRGWEDQYVTQFDTAVVGTKLLKLYDQTLHKRHKQ